VIGGGDELGDSYWRNWRDEDRRASGGADDGRAKKREMVQQECSSASYVKSTMLSYSPKKRPYLYYYCVCVYLCIFVFDLFQNK
jgi:hypothetical protein